MAIEGQRTMSKTQHYRKVTKPLLERKRRARMNHYLDELKDLIVETMESEGEHITKLEKADILELTVTYLKSKKQHEGFKEPVNAEKFREGYTQAAYEVSRVFASVPGVDVHFGTRVMRHLGHQMKELQPKKSSGDQKEIQSKYLSPRSPELDRRLQDQQQHEEKANDVWRPW